MRLGNRPADFCYNQIHFSCVYLQTIFHYETIAIICASLVSGYFVQKKRGIDCAGRFNWKMEIGFS